MDAATLNDHLLPREKLEAMGPGQLTDQELLAIVLNTGSKGRSCLDLAQGLLDRFGDIRTMARAEPVEFTRVKGIGAGKAAALASIFELGRRAAAPTLSKGQRLLCSADVFDAYHARLRDMTREIFLALALDNKNRCIRDLLLATGGGDSCTVDPREVFRKLLLYRAAAVIFVHNHPSGDPTPSREDRELTRRLVDAGDVLGIRILDHIVVGDGRYSSFADRGELRRAVDARNSTYRSNTACHAHHA